MPKELKSLYERFPSYTEEDVREAFLKLPIKDQNFYYENFGKDLSHSVRMENYSQANGRYLYNQVKIILEDACMFHEEELKQLASLLSCESMENLQKALDQLPKKEKRAIKSFLQTGCSNEKNQKILTKLQQLIEDPSICLRSRIYTTIYENFYEYSEEKVNDAISRLAKKDQEHLKLRYGEDFKRPVRGESYNRYDSTVYYRLIVPRIKMLLENSDLDYSMYSNMTEPVRSIYESFPRYTEEEINTAISKLEEKDRECVRNCYGNDLHHPKRMPGYTEEVLRYFQHKIVPKMRKILNPSLISSSKKKQRKTFFDLFSNYSKEEVLEAFSKLTPRQQEIVSLKYGKDLSKVEPSEEYSNSNRVFFYNKIVPVMHLLLNKQNTKKKEKKSRMLFYSYFSSFSKEELDQMILKLTSTERHLLYSCYGEDLTKPLHNADLSTIDQQKLSKLYNKMRYLLQVVYNYDKTNLFSYFKEYSEEQVLYVVLKLKEEERLVLRTYYGKDLKSHMDDELLSPEEKAKLSKILYKMRAILKNPCRKVSRSKEDVYEVFDRYTKQEIDQVISMVRKEENNSFAIQNLYPRIENLLRIQRNGHLMTLRKEVYETVVTNTSTTLTVEHYVKISDYLRSPFFQHLLTFLSAQEALLISLKLGYIQGIVLNDEELSTLFSISEEECKKITDRFLSKELEENRCYLSKQK